MSPVSSRPPASETADGPDAAGDEPDVSDGDPTGGDADPTDGPDGDAPAPPADELADLGVTETPEARRRSRLVLAGLVALLVTPLLIALVALRHPRWFPILDLAMTELRVRDVGTSHTPLVGLPGRIGTYPNQGSHPGPLSFWLLAPIYRLLGGTSSALEVATVALHVAAVGTALWLARRRGGIGLMLGMAAALAFLVRGYGAEFLTQPWNPYMPLLWWFVVLVAVWSVLCRDLVALPIAVFAGSFCAQTHAPYLGIVGGAGLIAAVAVVAAYRAADEAAGRRRVLRWVAGSIVLGAFLWLAPVLDQFQNEPGNFGLLYDHFASPPEHGIGLRRGVEYTLLHLNVWRFANEQGAAIGSLFGSDRGLQGSITPGILVLLVWLGSVAVAWQLRHRRLLRLHVVVAVSLVFSVVSISRIFGQVWYYLMTWAWGVSALLLLAVGWTAVAAFAARRVAATETAAGDRRAPVSLSPSLVRAGAAGLLVVTLLSTAVFSVDAATTDPPAPTLSTTMGALVPDTVAALEDGDQEYRGRDERYLVEWSDALYIGAQGIALLNELDRAGFDVGVDESWSPTTGRWRARSSEDATSYIQMANSTKIGFWRLAPDMVEVAYVDPRTPEQRARFEQLRTEVIDELRRTGLDDLIVDVDENLFAAQINPRVSKKAQAGMDEMADLGLPTAIFVGPPSSKE